MVRTLPPSATSSTSWKVTNGSGRPTNIRHLGLATIRIYKLQPRAAWSK
jgi:hypothetical protein